MEIDEVIHRLVAGNRRFVSDTTDVIRQHSKRRAELDKGQTPYAIVLGCSDSRVVPEYIFDVGLGDIFTVRVAGNVASPVSVASIEFAVSQFKSRVLIVMGHENCGAVTAAMDGSEAGYNLNHLLSFIKPAMAAVNSQDIGDIIKDNARHSARELAENSTVVAQAVKEGKLKIIPAYYQIVSGKVEFLD